MRLILRAITAVCVMLPGVAMADPSWFAVPQPSVSVGISSLGIGGSVGLHDPGGLLGLRASGHYFAVGLNFNRPQANSHAQVDLQNESILADVYPFHGRFRVSGGVVFNQDRARYTSTPVMTPGLQGYLNYLHYTGPVGDVSGPIRYDQVAPYVGVGYDAPVGRHWMVTADLGAMFQGKSHYSLTATGFLATQPAVAAAAVAYARQADRILNDFNVYPVLSVEVGYRF